MTIRPSTLFGKTLATIALVSMGFLFFTLSVMAKFLLVPVGERSAADLAAFMVFSAEAWSELPDEQQAPYARELEARSGLRIRPPQDNLPERGLVLPYFYFLENALEKQTGKPVTLCMETDRDGTPRYFARFDVGTKVVSVGVPRTHMSVQPPLALLLVFSVGILVTMATAITLVRRLTSPLERLSAATRRLGGGEWPAPLPETGPEELVHLTRSFNRMMVQVEELLANRTTLLAGISHDLRTPLSRMQVALEMLPAESDPELMGGLSADITHMNTLIRRFLEVARGLEDDRWVNVDMDALAASVAEAFKRSGAEIRIKPGKSCNLETSELALRRILENLLENAVRYGEGTPVDIEWHCSAGFIAIHILDRGPGIPENERETVFRPFYRLESSRSRATGGSGLGLAITRQLAQANGWEVTLLSRHGGGTRAVLKLPLATVRRGDKERGKAETAKSDHAL